MCQEQGPVLRIMKDIELKKAVFAFPPMNSKNHEQSNREVQNSIYTGNFWPHIQALIISNHECFLVEPLT